MPGNFADGGIGNNTKCEQENCLGLKIDLFSKIITCKPAYPFSSGVSNSCMDFKNMIPNGLKHII